MPDRDLQYEEEQEAKLLKSAANTIDGRIIPVISPICQHCKHLFSTLARTCAAYPRGIPLVIWNGDNDHQSQYPGDNGIVFSPVDNIVT